MTRKDYVLIAAALREALEHSDTEAKEGVVRAGFYVARALREENPRFDRGRFLAAADMAGHSLDYYMRGAR